MARELAPVFNRVLARPVLFQALFYWGDFIPDSIGQKSAPKKGQIFMGPFWKSIELTPSHRAPRGPWSHAANPARPVLPARGPGPNDTEHTANRCEDHEASYCIGPMGKSDALSFDEKQVWMKGTFMQEQDGENEADIA